MIEYRQYVPPDADAELAGRIEDAVCTALSQQASPTGDLIEFYHDVRITRRDSRQGGYWIHGALDRDPEADYLDTHVEPERYTVPGAISMEAKRGV